MYLSCIIEKLNRKLTVANENFAGAKYYNTLAVLVNRQDGSQVPLVSDKDKEVEIAIDDTYPLTVYHRVIRKPYTKNPNETFTTKAQMLMVVFGIKEKLKLETEQVESQLIKLFPKQLLKEDFADLEGVKNVYFEILESNLTARDVAASEYAGVKIPIDKDTILFSTRYDVEITFQKECLDFCDAVNTPANLCEWVAVSSADSVRDCLSDTQLTEMQGAICSAATAVLTDSEGVTILSEGINAGATESIIAPNGTVNLRNTDGDTITTVSVKSNQTKSHTIANVSWTDSDGSSESTPYGDTITCTAQVKTVELFFAFESGDDTSALATNSGTTWTLTSLAQDGSSGTITVSVNGGSYADFSNPTSVTNGQTIRVKRTSTGSAGSVTITGTYA